MLKSKDVDARLATMKRQLESTGKLFEAVEKGFKKVVEHSNELSNQLEQIEQAQTFGPQEKKAFDLEVKEWLKKTEGWADSLGSPQIGIENLIKQYNGFVK
jgi:hypothetical protein